MIRRRPRARELALALDHARELADILEPVGDLERSFYAELADVLDHALDLALYIGCNPERVGRDLDHYFNFARELFDVLDRVRDIDLDPDLNLTREAARDLYNHFAVLRASTKVAAVIRLRPSRAAQGLVGLAVRMLPVAQRSRYRAEFGVELAELSRGQQWGYALRVLASSWELRKALIQRMRIPDGELARRAEK